MRALMVVMCMLVASPASAAVWNPFKAAADKLGSVGRAIGGVLGAPAGGFLDKATTPVIHNVEDTAHRLIGDVDQAIGRGFDRGDVLVDHAGKTIATTLDQVDHSLAARILQVQTAVDGTADHVVDRLDLLIGRLDQDAQRLVKGAELAGKNLITQIDGVAKANLDRIDTVLAARTRDLQLVINSSIDEANNAARERLDQLDEIAGRRIGNVDVIVTKQSLSLEGMALRIAALIGLVGLIAFVSWRLFREIADALPLAGEHGGSRVRAIGWRSATRLLPQLALAAAGALVLIVLAKKLPHASKDRETAEIRLHSDAFDAAVRQLDVIGARYQESQIAILAPATAAALHPLVRKVELLNALFTRPGQLHTQQGLADVFALVGEVEQAFKAAHRAPDPDVTIAKAYVLWQVGGTRDDELEAARLCAEALQHGSSPLAPLARNYIRAFLHDPYTPHDAGAPSFAELDRLAAAPASTNEMGQFERVIELDELIAKLDRASTAAYLDMLAAHAELQIARAAHPRGAEPAAVQAARNHRTEAADRLIQAWASFDAALEASSGLAGDAMVMSVFALDDAVLSRARYYVERPEANDLAPLLSDKQPPAWLTPALRARIAPLRVAWEQRYAPLLGPRERMIVSYEEARRFEAFEQRAYAFEAAYIEFLVASRTGVAPAKLLDLATRAATRASGMGLYRDTRAGRVTEASQILAIAGNDGPHTAPELSEIIDHNYRIRRLRFL